MNTNSLITEVFTDIEAGKFEKANAILADDFRALLLGKEVNRPIFISAFRSLRQGIPDLKFTIQNVTKVGDKLIAKLKITGTNSHSIPALMRGWHEIPATNKKSGWFTGRTRNHPERRQNRRDQECQKHQGNVRQPPGEFGAGL